MSKIPLTVICEPERCCYEPDGTVLVRVELGNQTDREIEVLAAGVPWTFHHAVSFMIIEGAPEGVTFENRLWVIDPPSVPDITIAAGETASGEVDLAQYLYSAEGKSIGQVPGTYLLRAHVIALASTGRADPEFERLEIDSEPFTVVIRD